MRKFGLIGYPLTHSFSKKYFTEKFEKENIPECSYQLFEMENIKEFTSLLRDEPLLKGLNVTIPHKKNVLPYLNSLDKSAENVGAVNVIKISEGKLIGYNSDYFGFMNSLRGFVKDDLEGIKALVLGTGGAASAVTACLKDLNIPYLSVSRTDSSKDTLTYEDLKDSNFSSYRLIINTTPLGMYPNVNTYPDIPYDKIDSSFYLFDLVYNPRETLFLNKGASQGAKTMDGLEMLILQAEKAWEIWNY